MLARPQALPAMVPTSPVAAKSTKLWTRSGRLAPGLLQPCAMFQNPSLCNATTLLVVSFMGMARWRRKRQRLGVGLRTVTTWTRESQQPMVIPTRERQQLRVSSADNWFSKLQPQDGLVVDRPLSERGLAALEVLDAPARTQEPWRYTDLKVLLYNDVETASEVYRESQRPRDYGEEQGELHTQVKDLLEDVTLPTSSTSSTSLVFSRLVFVDGVLSEELSRFGDDLDASTFVGGNSALRARGDDATRSRATKLLQGLPEVDAFPEAGKIRDALGCAKLAALNLSLLQDFALVRLPGKGQVDETPQSLHVEAIFVSTGATASPVTSPRLLLDVGAGRQVHLVETHLSVYPSDTSLSNGVCRVILAEGAIVKHELVQQKGDHARFVESVTAELAQSAEYDLRVIQTGARAARVNAAIKLAGEFSSCELKGVMVAGGKQQLDLHSLIHHAIPSCRSKQLHKNVAAGAAECIFKGSIRVDKEAQLTKSEQLCRTLLLSNRARVKAMPSLQIQADDVVCSHGAAVTELDPEQVFYLSSRGLSGWEARRLLLHAFPQDLLAGLESSAPKAYHRVLDKLEGVAGEGEYFEKPGSGTV